MARRGKGRRLKGDALPLIRRLWREWMRPHAPALALVLLLVALVSGATGLYPVLIKAAFDAFTARDPRAIMLAPLFVIAVTLTKGFSLYGHTFLTNRVVTRIEADMQTALYGAPDRRRPRPGRAREPGRADAALHHGLRLHQGGADAALDRVPARGRDDRRRSIAAMLWIDPVLTLVAGVIVPFIAHADRQDRPEAAAGRDLDAGADRRQMASLISESLAGRPGRQDLRPRGLSQGARRRDAFDDVRKLKMKAANARGRLDPLLEAGGGLAVAARAHPDRLAHPRRRQHGRRFHGLRQRPDPRRAADPGARQPQRHRAGGGRGPAADLRDHGRGARASSDRPDARAARRRAAARSASSASASAIAATPSALDGVDLVGRAARPRRWSAARARASRRCCPSCRASTTSPAAPS